MDEQQQEKKEPLIAPVDWVAIAGVISVITGVAMLSHAAAFIVAGVGLLWLSWTLSKVVKERK